MQNVQILKSHIISVLDFLSLESLKLLAKFVDFLYSGVAQDEIVEVESLIEVEIPTPPLRVVGARLANRNQAEYFKKTVVEVHENELV